MSRRTRFALALVALVSLGSLACSDVTAPRSTCEGIQSSGTTCMSAGIQSSGT